MRPVPFTPNEATEVYNYLIGEGGDGVRGELTDEASYKLYVYLEPEMPHGVRTADTGTPDEWYPDYFASYGEEGVREWVEDRTAGVPQGV